MAITIENLQGSWPLDLDFCESTTHPTKRERAGKYLTSPCFVTQSFSGIHSIIHCLTSVPVLQEFRVYQNLIAFIFQNKRIKTIFGERHKFKVGAGLGCWGISFLARGKKFPDGVSTRVGIARVMLKFRFAVDWLVIPVHQYFLFLIQYISSLHLSFFIIFIFFVAYCLLMEAKPLCCPVE